MTERPTEQTQQRLAGSGAASADPRSDVRANGAPVLPPMPRPELRPQSDQDDSRVPLADRLQQRLQAVRQATGSLTGSASDTERPSPAPTAGPETTVRPAPGAEAQQSAPVLPPPPAELVERQRETQPTPAARPAAQPTRTTRATRAAKRPPRRARLRLTRIDPWSVMKTAFLLSIAIGVVTIVSVLMVWSVLGAAGVWDSINTAVRDIVGDQASTPFTIQNYLGTDRVIGFTMLVAVIDVVLLTALSTLAAFLYNMAAALLGGIDVTLVEDEH